MSRHPSDVFDFSHDRLLFDVGHQCYPHKLITGRFRSLSKLRKTGGISHRPIQKVEIIVNGTVIASRSGDERRTEISLPFEFALKKSSWIAARAQAESQQGEPDIKAHANPVYFLKQGEPVHIEADREAPGTKRN